MNALFIGSSMAKHRIADAQDAARREHEEEEHAREEAEKEAAEILHQVASSTEVVPEHHLVVARLSSEAMKNVKLKEILGPLKSVINVALPLVGVPPLHQVRNTLLFEFLYAMEVIDFALADLVDRTTVRLRPLLLVGDPGGGKSRFARRLGEVLGLSVWREDASRADGATFGGTDRRWSHISFVATANGLDPLPSAIRDRCRVATFPKPSMHDINAILPAVIADLARERGVDEGWVQPLDGTEHAAVTRLWRGGSVRRLRRVVEAILRERDLRATRN